MFDAFRGRPGRISRDDLELLCLELATGDIPTGGTSAWLADRYPADIIEILWQAGFLTVPSANGARASGPDGRPFLGVHQIQHANLPAAREFGVHPMFRAYLGI